MPDLALPMVNPLSAAAHDCRTVFIYTVINSQRLDHDDAPWFWIFDNAICLPARYAWRANSALATCCVDSMVSISSRSSGVSLNATDLADTPSEALLRLCLILCKVQLVTSYTS